MPDSLIIPACPEILLELTAIMNESEPDIQVVADLVNADVGLFSTLLATVNSPALGLQQSVESVPQAIMLLGQKRTFTLLHSAVMRNSLEQHGRLDRFWDSATEIAGLCTRLAAQLTTVNQDKAYSIGMLHDIGIPVMMANHPNYRDFLREIGSLGLQELSAQEVEHFQVDHFTLGYRLAKEWNLPSVVSKTLLLQPLFERAFNHSIDVHDNLLSYLAILMLAKDISSEYRYFWRLSASEHLPEYLLPILEFLEIPRMEYLDIKEKLIEDIEDTEEQHP
jgi:HD-like signal output (HDOD) protein